MVELDTEARWLADIAKGGRKADQALAGIFDAYAKSFINYLCCHRMTLEEAEDVVSLFFEKLVKQRGRLPDITYAKAYLWKTLKNTQIDYIRKRHREPIFDDIDTLPQAAVHQSTDDIIDYLECVQRSFEQYRETSGLKAEAIDLAVFGGLAGKELAVALGKSYGATREFLSRARKEFAALTARLCGVDPQEI